MDFHVFHSVALGLVRIGLVHKALLQLVIGALRVLRCPMRLMKLIGSVLAGNKKVFVLQLFAVMAEVIVRVGRLLAQKVAIIA